MSKQRKRRAASLTAEALWNIQLQDDAGERKKRECKEESRRHEHKKIPPRQSVMPANPSPLDKMGSTSNKSPYIKHKTAPDTILASRIPHGKSQTCVHSDSVHSGNARIYRNKGKLTASVAPLMKQEAMTQNVPSSSRRQVAGQNISAVPGTSQVLLVPISLDASGNSGSEGSCTLPLITLHASPVELMHCFDRSAQIVSPLVSVSSLLSSTSNPNIKISPDNFKVKNARFDAKPTSTNKSSTELVESQPDQTEPLNLKLGESSIPSRSVEKPARSMLKSQANKPLLFRGSGRLLSDFQSSRCQSSGCPTTTQALLLSKHISLGKIGSAIKRPEPLQYEALSPTSDSPSSSDHEDGPARKTGERRQRHQINLRCKAAPPPHQRHFMDPSDLERKRKEISRKRRRISDSAADFNNGWKWDGKPYEAYVYSVELNKSVRRWCYPAVRRKCETSSGTKTAKEVGDDLIMVHDCVMMRADGDQQPYVAKVAALWRHPVSKTVMISLLWYYRPEHTEDPRVQNQLGRYNDDELFASRHLDEISVECVEDKCYVLTYYQYCRFLAASEKKDSHIGVVDGRAMIPPRRHPDGTLDMIRNLPVGTCRSIVYYCRRHYDIKLHRLLKTLPPPNPLFPVFPNLTEANRYCPKSNDVTWK